MSVSTSSTAVRQALLALCARIQASFRDSAIFYNLSFNPKARVRVHLPLRFLSDSLDAFAWSLTEEQALAVIDTDAGAGEPSAQAVIEMPLEHALTIALARRDDEVPSDPRPEVQTR
jgi:hypothetical protein